MLLLRLLLLLRRLRVNESRTVPERPLLKPWYRLAQVEDGVLLEHGRSVVAFGGAAATTFLPALLPLLDGTRTTPEIVDVVGPEVAAAVEQALRLLSEHDLLTDGPRLDVGARRAVVETLAATAGPGTTLDELAQRLASAGIRIVGHGVLADPLARLLHLSGVDDVTRGAPADDPGGLVVVAPGPAEQSLYAEWNQRGLRDNIAWIPIGEYDGRTLSVGPLIVPAEGPCHTCLQLRRESTSGCAHELAQLRDVPAGSDPRPTVLALAAAVAAEVVVRWVAAGDPSLPGTLFTLESAPLLQVESHVVLRVPRCPVCSPAAAAAPQAPWHEAMVA
ncbi:MAG: TOMM precursor leader peptide-binding protein [Gaiellaceae bacterium MAG52_C11]|nr:TOMM precursor leader peptide-binding protein [Candidatus Gaiellasilicea maunaloa]